MRALGVDLGGRRIGLALSDPTGTVAQPWKAIAPKGGGDAVAGAAQAVAETARALGVEVVVVGLPRHMNGQEGEGARVARAVAADLRERLGLRVELWDERLTTVAAERALREGGVSARRRREKVDKMAAALILQGFLDARRGRPA
ncbi:MAG: Holliday junction resolvase RuvX [Firmicutes bacterium]|nr:Holliday junction resolvase RuvX [Bacillota bacterium]